MTGVAPEDGGGSEPSAQAEVITPAPADPAATTREVLTALASRWPTLTVFDLQTVRTWAELQHGQGHQPETLSAHLFEGWVESTDPRVQLALQMSADPKKTTPAAVRPLQEARSVATTAPMPQVKEPSRLAREEGRLAQIRLPIPHALITLDLPGWALELWLILGTLPATDLPGGLAVDAAFIATRAGWTDSNGRPIAYEAAKRRVQRAAKALDEAGALRITRQRISGARTRSVYQRLVVPGAAGQHFELVTFEVVRQLSPALLVAFVRWLQILGSHRRTELSWGDLSRRWGTSTVHVRRQAQDLQSAGLILIERVPHVVRLVNRPASLVSADIELDRPPTPRPVSPSTATLEEKLTTPHMLADITASQPPKPASRRPVDNPGDKNVFVAREEHFCRPLVVHTRNTSLPPGTSVPLFESLPGPRADIGQLSPAWAPAAIIWRARRLRRQGEKPMRPGGAGPATGPAHQVLHAPGRPGRSARRHPRRVSPVARCRLRPTGA